MAAFMTSRISAEMPGGARAPAAGEGSVTKLPPFLHEPFSAALSQSLLLPAFVALFGVVAAIFLRGFGDRPPRAADDGSPAQRDDVPRQYVPDESDYFPDDDEYVEYTIDWDEPHPPPRRDVPAQEAAVPAPVDVVDADDSETEPLPTHVEHPLPAPAESWHGGPVESWHSLLQDEAAESNGTARRHGILDDLLADAEPAPKPNPDPIGFAHNGFHVEHEERFRTLPPPAPERSGRHARGGDDDGTYGRHSTRFHGE
jgi:hypothetical protein